MKIWKEKNGDFLDDFKILTVTDLHFSETANDFCLKVLDQYIQTEHPDLIVLCGDTISRSTATKLPYEMIDFFEERNQY
ncbi:MAG: metallophosphoesterase [Mycoplasmoidaceae bacterium]|nr:metallophosphoesterase [Mycoplasmoidaceae bacterium]